jgi:hypothetical protein
MREKREFNFSIRELKAYTKRGKLNEWVFAYLHGPGINKAMAKGLMWRKENHYHSWVGPINFPLKELSRCCGSEEGMEYPETGRKWNKRVTSMTEEIKKGWEAPVLIVNPRPWPILSIRDGNHRFEALIRTGKKKYPTIFWFESPKDRQRFIRKYKDIV